MSYFRIKRKEIQYSSDDFGQLASILRKFSDAIDAIDNNLSIDSAQRANFHRALKLVSDKIISDAASMDTLSSALTLIASEYSNTEKLLLGTGAVTDFPNSGSNSANVEEAISGFWDNLKKRIDETLEKIRFWLVDHEIKKAKKQERAEGEPVTKQQEREHDLYMKQQVTEIRKEKRFSEKTWKKASTEERKQILQDYIDRIYAIMGLPSVTVRWSNEEAENGYVTMGYYSDGDDSVHINEWVIENGDANHFSSYDLISSIAHEMRHYYQKEATRHPEKYIVTAETIQSWQDSYDNYKSQEMFMDEDGMTEREAYEAYRNQTIEVDARWFQGAD